MGDRLATIRRATKADGPAVFDLLWSAREQIPLKPSFYSDDNKKWITRECASKRVWLAEIDSRIVGALYHQLSELFYLVVAADFRRSGLARALLAKVKRRGRWARVAPGNLAVIRLLESEGFVRNPDRLTADPWIAYDYIPSR